MKRLSTILGSLLLLMGANAQNEQFAITLKVDSAIASEPQKVYLYSQIENQMQLHDSLHIDSVHRIGTLHGSVPYEYAVHLMFARRGPGVVPVVVVMKMMASACAIPERWKARQPCRSMSPII